MIVGAHMENTPHRLLDTSASRLCDREAQISAFTKSPKYNELLLSMINFQHATILKQRIDIYGGILLVCHFVS